MQMVKMIGSGHTTYKFTRYASDEANQKRREYRAWAHGEMELWLQNDESMYNRLHRIVSHPKYSVKAKAATLKIVFGDFHNGSVKVGSYANFQRIAADVWAEYVEGQYGRFESVTEYLAYYGTIRNNVCSKPPYPASRPCHVTITEVPTLQLTDGL